MSAFGAKRTLAGLVLNGRFWRWFQQVGATPVANPLLGDLPPKSFWTIRLIGGDLAWVRSRIHRQVGPLLKSTV
jgi:hypothetical protein